MLLSGIQRLSYAPTIAAYQPQFQETADEVTVLSDYAGPGRAGKFAKAVSIVVQVDSSNRINTIQSSLVGKGDHEAGFYKLAAFVTKRTLTEKQ